MCIFNLYVIYRVVKKYLIKMIHIMTYKNRIVRIAMAI